MQTHDIAPHMTTLTRALGDKIGTQISEDDLREELQKYLDYGVPPDQAVRTILRHHGADPGATPRQEAPAGRVPLSEAPGNVPSIDLLVRVLTLNTKTVNARGEDKEILWGLVGDETATLPYTSWRPLEGLAAGDVVEVKEAYTKEWRGETQIQFGDRTRVTKKDPSELPDRPATYEELQVNDLRPGLRAFKVTGRFLTVGTKEVEVQGEPKTLWTGTFADDSGRIEYTCWDDVGLEEGSVMTLQGGSVRTFQGAPQLNFDQDSSLTPFEGDFPEAAVLDVPTVVTLRSIVEAGNRSDATVRASLLEVRDGSGLVFRCGEEGCNRVLQGSQCFEHGRQDGTPDLRVKMILDDGTAAVSAVVGRDFVESVLGKDLDACVAEAKDAMRHEVIQEQIADRLVGRVYVAEGFARTDDYGTMFIARAMREEHEDVEQAANALLAELGGEA